MNPLISRIRQGTISISGSGHLRPAGALTTRRPAIGLLGPGTPRAPRMLLRSASATFGRFAQPLAHLLPRQSILTPLRQIVPGASWTHLPLELIFRRRIVEQGIRPTVFGQPPVRRAPEGPAAEPLAPGTLAAEPADVTGMPDAELPGEERRDLAPTLEAEALPGYADDLAPEAAPGDRALEVPDFEPAPPLRVPRNRSPMTVLSPLLRLAHRPSAAAMGIPPLVPTPPLAPSARWVQPQASIPPRGVERLLAPAPRAWQPLRGYGPPTSTAARPSAVLSVRAETSAAAWTMDPGTQTVGDGLVPSPGRLVRRDKPVAYGQRLPRATGTDPTVLAPEGIPARETDVTGVIERLQARPESPAEMTAPGEAAGIAGIEEVTETVGDLGGAREPDALYQGSPGSSSLRTPLFQGSLASRVLSSVLPGRWWSSLVSQPLASATPLATSVGPGPRSSRAWQAAALAESSQHHSVGMRPSVLLDRVLMRRPEMLRRAVPMGPSIERAAAPTTPSAERPAVTVRPASISGNPSRVDVMRGEPIEREAEAEVGLPLPAPRALTPRYLAQRHMQTVGDGLVPSPGRLSTDSATDSTDGDGGRLSTVGGGLVPSQGGIRRDKPATYSRSLAVPLLGVSRVDQAPAATLEVARLATRVERVVGRPIAQPPRIPGAVARTLRTRGIGRSIAAAMQTLRPARLWRPSVGRSALAEPPLAAWQPPLTAEARGYLGLARAGEERTSQTLPMRAGMPARAQPATVAGSVARSVRRPSLPAQPPSGPGAPAPSLPVQPVTAEAPGREAHDGTSSPGAEVALPTPSSADVVLPVALSGLPPDLVGEAAARDWPILADVARHVRRITSGETAITRVLRRLPSLAAERVISTLASLPSLGPGEPLAESARRPMEAISRRDLSSVRVYSSPVAETLGARAFTSGQRIVFAPGRLRFETAPELALLGHEVAHVGEALAFKQESGEPTSGDTEEAAERQEALVQRIVERGWPAPLEMVVRRTGQPVAEPPLRTPSAYSQMPSPPDGPVVARAAASDDSSSDSQGAEVIPEARFSVPTEEPKTGKQSVDVDALARKVYDILKGRLRAERDRHGSYARA